MDTVDANPAISRRRALQSAGTLAMALGALELTGPLGFKPTRAYAATTPSDIQFDIGAFLTTGPQSTDGVTFQMGPVHTIFLTARLLRTPTRADQTEMNRVLNQLEASYPWGATHLVTFVSYGIPYFNRLPGGMNGTIVSSRMPRLLSNNSRFALEEAVPGPTDVSPQNPGISKLRFNVPVAIEQNDMLFTLRSDNPQFLTEVLNWFNGNNTLRGQPARSPAWSGLISFTSSRHMFQQAGLPQAVAQQNNLPFKNFIQHQSPMWMGFLDQQTNAAGPAPIVTFAGNSSARLTNATPGSYFDNGSIQHLSHVILDLLQWFDMDSASSPPGDDGVFTERVQYMYHSPAIHPGFTDQFNDGGGPSILPNQNRGPNYALQTAQGIGTEDNDHRVGHLSTLQRSSRAADGTPIHIRMDGAGFDNMDVPGGANTPKLEFTVFVPTADFFANMRRNQASRDLQQQFNIPDADNGLERFITATRRQNFLCPPRRNRSFPLVEFT
ncbi:MAG TPA: hypothetical protein VF069_07705 [Streptosporangiaceae bacterium]